MHLISAGAMAEADGYIGYMKPYATSHEELDKDKAFRKTCSMSRVRWARRFSSRGLEGLRIRQRD